MKIVTRRAYKSGVVDSIESRSIPPGAASASLGWVTLGDKIELVRGRLRLGTEVAGVGRVSGIGVGKLINGTTVLFSTYGTKARYYNSSTSDWVEIGTDALTSSVVTAANPYGEDISISPYTNLAGPQVWMNSPSIGALIKILVANPGSFKDNYDASKNFKGYMRHLGNRALLWRRGGATKDETGLYGSKLDKDEVSDYTQVTGESIGTGDGATVTFAGTLVALSGKRTAFGVAMTDGVETFSDSKDGTLSGSAGGTGTINYTTGAYSITFFVAPLNLAAITGSYYWEDSTAGGTADFTKSTPRVAAEGFVIRQDDAGGPFQWPALYNGITYCLHVLKTWAFSLSADDETATNTVYRDKVGIPNLRASAESGEGVYYIDDTDESDPRVRLLTLDSSSAQVVPVPISNNLNLKSYRFDKAAGIEWGDYILFACRTSSSDVNNRVLAYSRKWTTWDILPYWVSCFSIKDGVLVAGDSLSNNVYELFSGLDDDGAIVENFWIGGSDLVEQEGMKKVPSIVLEGDIGPNQGIRVYVGIDNGTFVEIGKGAATAEWPDGIPAIVGSGAYVDRTNRSSVGSTTLGRGEVAGGSELNEDIEAYHYERKIRLEQSRFEYAKIKYEAVAIGYASVSRKDWWDVRFKSNKIPQKYRV